MKKSMTRKILIVLILALLGVGGIVLSHVEIGGSIKDITYEEVPLVGDAKAAEGLEMTLRRWAVPNLDWETTMTVGGKAENNFSPPALERMSKNAVNFWVPLGTSMSTNITQGYTRKHDGMDIDPYAVFLWDVADRTEVGGDRTEVIRFADYYDTYRLNCNLFIHGTYCNVYWQEENMKYDDERENEKAVFVRELAGAFRFPVDEAYTVEARIVKKGGTVREMYYTSKTMPPQIWGWSAVTDQYAYFIVDACNGDGQRMNYTDTPGGFSVYRLPCTDGKLTMADLETVMTLDLEDRVKAMKVSPDQQNVLLVLEQEGKDVLYVLDGESGREKLHTEVAQAGEQMELCTAGEAVLCFSDRNYVMLDLAKGEEPVWKGSLPAELCHSVAHVADKKETVCACDGNRFALMVDLGDWYRPETDGGALLVVLDEKGVAYAEELLCSMQKGGGLTVLGPDDTQPLQLKWT